LIIKPACAQTSPSPTLTSTATATPTVTPTPSPTPSPTATPTAPPTPSPTITPTPPPYYPYTTPTAAAIPTPSPTPPPSPDVSPIFKPSVPEFTLYLVNQPYQISPTTPTYTTDPYTGETKLQNPGSPGYQVDNWTIQLWIPNMQFNYLGSSATYHLYYNVRTKGHFEQSWRELYSPFNGLHSANYNDNGTFIPNGSPAQSNNVYTVITYSAYTVPYYTYPPVAYPPNAQVDFQISAILGHDSQIFVDDHPLVPMLIGHEEPAISYDIQSDWSNTQTLTISNSSLSISTPQNPIASTQLSKAIPVATQNPTATPSPTPIIPEFPTLTAISLLVGALFITMIVRYRKNNSLSK
jgi:hypothetical protein